MTIETGIEGIGKVADAILQICKENGIVFLNGKVGSGKTTLVAALLKALNIKEQASSPTFSVQNIYENRVFHYDMYNKSFEDLVNLGLIESFDETGVHFVEWGDEKLRKTLQAYGYEILDVAIEENGNSRIYRIQNA